MYQDEATSFLVLYAYSYIIELCMFWHSVQLFYMYIIKEKKKNVLSFYMH